MSKLLMLGECMLELKPQSDAPTLLNFAGDTYNAAVYAKRYERNHDVAFVSCIGQDPFSQQLQQVMKTEQLSNQWLVNTERAAIGIYAIATDEDGERSFHYWRKDSAATKLFDYLDINELQKELVQGDVLFFSGISLAILSNSDKEKLLQLAISLRKQKVTVAFDLNYRAKMWSSQQEAVVWFKRFFACVDIVLPGLDEQELLFGHSSAEQTLNFYQSFGVKEIVVKADLQGVFAYCGEQSAHQSFEPAPQQVDSTAAGDSFAGTYISARAAGKNLAESIASACDVARLVVQYPGAIISDEIYQSL